MNQTPAHWKQFDLLYNLSDPRPYFSGVKAGEYRMPGVIAAVLKRLAPVLAENRLLAEKRRSPSDLIKVVDFGSGYGAVGMCLRGNRQMSDLFSYFSRTEDPDVDPERMALNTSDPYEITGIDIADRALDYARSVGALNSGYCEDVTQGHLSQDLSDTLSQASLIYECGAIGDHIVGAVDSMLGKTNGAWLLFSPRPRISVQEIENMLLKHSYIMETLVRDIRYRKPFSASELAEEIQDGISNGLTEEECLIDGFFRVHIRLAVPKGTDTTKAHEAMSGFNPNDLLSEI